MDDRSWIQRVLSHRATFVAVLVTVALLVVPIAMVFAPKSGTVAMEPLPVLGNIPAFNLVDQHNKPISDADLKGQISVVSFIFTSCTSACPMLTARMVSLASTLSKDRVPELVLLSITVDPERDDPAALLTFAAENGATDSRWRFLTGDPAAVREVIAGFKIAAQHQSESPDGNYDVVHTERFALLDDQGQLRGFYHADPEGQRALARDAYEIYLRRPGAQLN